MSAEIQTYFDKMESLMNECQKHIEAMELDKAKEKNQEISNVLSEMIEWCSNNGHKDKVLELEKMKNETFSFFDTIIKLLENNVTVDEARATLKEAGII
jgi:predicted CopG family antitoxin